MNGNENQTNNSNFGVYKANVNLNTAIENPNIDVDSATSVNIQNNQFVGSEFSQNSEFNVNNTVGSIDNSYDFQNNATSFNNGSNANWDNRFLEHEGSGNTINSNGLYYNNSTNSNGLDYNNVTNSDDFSYNSSNNLSTVGFDSTSSNHDDVYTDVSNNENINYEPVYEKKEEKDFSLNLVASKELKFLIFIAFLLFIFILLLPYLFDFTNKIWLAITS